VGGVFGVGWGLCASGSEAQVQELGAEVGDLVPRGRDARGEGSRVGLGLLGDEGEVLMCLCRVSISRCLVVVEGVARSVTSYERAKKR
jgi:hypothetical protein